MADPVNRNQMTQAEWAQYQREEGAKPEGQRASPDMWRYNRKQGPLPQQDQYVYDGGAWVPNEYWSGQLAEQERQRNASRQDIDPQRENGRRFNTSLDSGQKEGYLNYKSRYAPNMTEYEYRKKFGLDTTTVPGSYDPITYGSYGHSTNTAPVGSGDKKLAGQAKVVTDKSGTRVKEATPNSGAKQSVAGNQIKTSATTTANKNSAAGQAAAKAQGRNQPAKEAAKKVENVRQTATAPKIVKSTAPQPTVKLTAGSTAAARKQRAIEAHVARTGDIVGKDGKVIQRVQEQGNREGQRTVTAYRNDAEYKQAIATQRASEREAAAELARVQREWDQNPLTDKNGNVINQIQKQGSRGTGNRNVRVVTTLRSGSTYSRDSGQTAADTERTQQIINDRASASFGKYAPDRWGSQDNRATNKTGTIEAVVTGTGGQYIQNIKDTLAGMEREFRKSEVFLGGKAGLGYELTEKEASQLQRVTGIGRTDKKYSDRTNQATRYLMNVQGEVDQYTPQIVDLFNSLNTNANKALGIGIGNMKVLGVPVGGAIKKYGESIDNLPDGFINTGYKNLKRSMTGSVMPGLITSTSKTPTLIAQALQEAEYLYKNPGAFLPTVAFAAAAMPAGIAKGAYDNPAEMGASLLAQEGALRGALGVSKLGIKSAGRGTGLIRDKTVVIHNAPLHPVGSQTAMIEAVTKRNTISGVRATHINRAIQPVQGNPVGIKTFTLPKSLHRTLQAYEELAAEVKGVKYKPHDNKYTVGRTIQKLTSRERTLTRSMETGRLRSKNTPKGEYDTSYANPVHTSYMVPDLTDGKIEMVGSHFLSKGGGGRLKEEVQLVQNVPTVASELRAEHLRALDELATRGKVDPKVYSEIAKLAEEKSRRINQPVAYPSPKTVSGAKPELEVLMAYGSDKAVRVTSSKFAGFTQQGYPIRKIVYGEGKPLGSLDGIKAILENAEYNWGNVLSNKGRWNEGMSIAQNRKLAELRGDAPMKPGQYGAHGPKHTAGVVREITKIWESSPTLQSKYSLKEMQVAAKLHDTARIFGGETEPVKHGQSLAANIRAGRIKDPELLALPKKSRMNVADAIDTHMWIKPGFSPKTILKRPSDIQKALATADRTARAVEHGKPVRSGTAFKIPEETNLHRFGKLLEEAERSFNESSLMKDTRAELGRRNPRELGTTEIKRNERITRTSKPRTETYTKEYRQVGSRRLKAVPYRETALNHNSRVYSTGYHVENDSVLVSKLAKYEAENNKNNFRAEKYTSGNYEEEYTNLIKSLKLTADKTEYYPDKSKSSPYDIAAGRQVNPKYTPSKGGDGGSKGAGYSPSGGSGNYPPGSYPPGSGGGSYPGGSYPPDQPGGNYPPPPTGTKGKGYSKQGNGYRPPEETKRILLKKKKQEIRWTKEYKDLQKAKRRIVNKLGTLIY